MKDLTPASVLFGSDTKICCDHDSASPTPKLSSSLSRHFDKTIK